MASSVTSALILLLFLSVALHESGTRNALLSPWKFFLPPLLVLKIAQLQDKLLNSSDRDSYHCKIFKSEL